MCNQHPLQPSCSPYSHPPPQTRAPNPCVCSSCGEALTVLNLGHPYQFAPSPPPLHGYLSACQGLAVAPLEYITCLWKQPPYPVWDLTAPTDPSYEWVPSPYQVSDNPFYFTPQCPEQDIFLTLPRGSVPQARPHLLILLRTWWPPSGCPSGFFLPTLSDHFISSAPPQHGHVPHPAWAGVQFLLRVPSSACLALIDFLS